MANGLLSKKTGRTGWDVKTGGDMKNTFHQPKNARRLILLRI
jgi:hypothetical protein